MDANNLMNVRIGDVLKEYGYVNDEQINEALNYQRQNRGIRLGGALIALNFISESQMIDALARSLSLQRVNLDELNVNVEIVALIPRTLAEKYNVLCIAEGSSHVTVVMNDPMNFYGIEEIRTVLGRDLEIKLSELAPLQRAIHYYYAEVSAREAAEEANSQFAVEEDNDQIIVDENDDEAPITNLLNRLVRRAYSTNTSDIHIEPFEQSTIVRMRIDGTLVEYMTLQKNLHNSLIARIKILSDLDIAERRIPQDGHFRMVIDGSGLNIRVSVIPTVFGEKAVLRLLASNTKIDHSGTFGMDREAYEKFSKMLKSPNGIIYLTGPTGSGKSTTLYMVLESLSNRNVNICTIEDPVEKNVPRINQTQVNPVAGLTFETGLRALLRQDPDIIMVGETRDSETAEISVRAAITGHVVFSTLHTNDAASAVVRLVDMGLEPYMIASSVVGVVAQRLMRKVCPNCSTEEELTAEEKERLLTPINRARRAKGCRYCNQTGYIGRVAIHEILSVDRTVRNMINERKSVEEIRDYAICEQGMKTLRVEGERLVAEGVTTMEELYKVAYYD